MSAFATQSQPKQFLKFKVLKDSPGSFLRVAVFNKGATKAFIQVHDASAEPATDAPCTIPFPVDAGTTETFEYKIECGTGVTVAGSKTNASYTPLDSDDLYIVADSQ